MEILKVETNSRLWQELKDFSSNCSWIAGKHLASMMENNSFDEWESVFAAVLDCRIIGFCTFLKTDYYPENRYSPWISSIFVDEEYRGNRLSEKMIDRVIEYARELNFTKVYIPSGMSGFYEKYGFRKVDELKNYDGETDNILEKEI